MPTSVRAHARRHTRGVRSYQRGEPSGILTGAALQRWERDMAFRIDRERLAREQTLRMMEAAVEQGAELRARGGQRLLDQYITLMEGRMLPAERRRLQTWRAEVD